MNLNVVALQGNLVKDPTIHGEERTVARFTIAINNGYGEKKTTTFVDCVAFGKQVATIEKYLTKGKQVIVNGQLSQSNWENEEGQKRSKLEVRLNNYGGFSFAGNVPRSDDSEENSPEPEKVSGEKLF